jgi:hypothetical protein
MKFPAEDYNKSRFAYYSGQHFQALKPIGNRKTYSEIRYIFEPHSLFQIRYVPLESAHIKVPDGSEKRKWIKMDFSWTLHITQNSADYLASFRPVCLVVAWRSYMRNKP